MTKLILSVLALAWLAACGDAGNNQAENEAPAADSKQVEEDVADITDYRLTMDKIDKMYQAQLNMAVAMKDMSPEEREAAEISSDANESLDQMVAKIEGNPRARDAIRKAGISPRDYIMTAVAYFTSAMAASVLDMRPKDNQDSLAREMKVNTHNIQFIRQNKAELERRQKAMEAEAQRLGVKG